MDDSELSLRDDMTLDYVIRVEDVPPTGRDASFELPEEMRDPDPEVRVKVLMR